MKIFFRGLFRPTLLYIILIEQISLFAYLLPQFRQIVFWEIVLFVFILAFYNLRYALLITLAELFISSKGYLLYFEFGNYIFSLRMAFWLIIILVWTLQLFQKLLSKQRNNNLLYFLKIKSIKYYSLLFAFIFLAVLNAFWQQNNINNIFLDANAWLYFGLLLPILSVFSSSKSLRELGQVFTASVTWLSIKTLLLLYIFSHSFTTITAPIYHWVRSSGVGEITDMNNGFYRIFFQSHIFVLVAFFLFSYLFIKQFLNKKMGKKEQSLTILFLSLLNAVNIISFSRSNWIGLASGLIMLSIFVIWQYDLKKYFSIVIKGLLIFFISFLIIAAVVKFPFPSNNNNFNTATLVTERASQVSSEAAVSSRWQLLPVMWQGIKSHWLLGSGFGATLTYKSSDPRVVATTGDGNYTTFAFEWGWLDIWFKLGFFGLLAYLTLLINIIWQATALIISKKNSHIAAAVATGVGVISTINFFSPYLNHPLGIGYLMLASAILFQLKKNKEIKY